MCKYVIQKLQRRLTVAHTVLYITNCMFLLDVWIEQFAKNFEAFKRRNFLCLEKKSPFSLFVCLFVYTNCNFSVLEIYIILHSAHAYMYNFRQCIGSQCAQFIFWMLLFLYVCQKWWFEKEPHFTILSIYGIFGD